VPVLIKGEIYSLLGKKISSDDEKLISFFFGVGLILFYFVVFHLRIEK
jgi:tetrahydromethanopterin S-methyltransferase subunit G